MFTRDDAFYVWGILAGSSVGLLATTLGRLYSSAWYALHETRVPLKFAVVRVLLTTGLGVVAALRLPAWLHLAPRWGAAGLTASAGVAGWLEFLLLRRSLDRKIGTTRLPPGYLLRLWTGALLALGAARAVLLLLAGSQLGPIATALLVLLPFGVTYLGASLLFRVPLAYRVIGRTSPGA
jgi:putative peptidoglycan lipid II flippase